MVTFKKVLDHQWVKSKIIVSNSQIVDDERYLNALYYILFGKQLNLKNPQSFNEKLNWLKLNDRKPIYTTLADKYAVKKYVADRIGREYVVENYIVANEWKDIDFSLLPDRFVIKCTHDSGGAFVCRSKVAFDFLAVRKIVERNLQKNFFYSFREWPYKDIKPRIIVDRLLDDHTGNELRDYKFWCFNGVPMYMYLTIKGKGIYENFYDMDFHPVMIDHGFLRHQPEFKMPRNFELMKELATILSDGKPFVRVDFFDVDGRVYFGEFTFYDWAGMRPFRGEWDSQLGKLIDIHNV